MAVSLLSRAFVKIPFLCIVAFSILSCARSDHRTAILWTDRPEFAEYVELFNAAQSRYRIELYYREKPGQALASTEKYPDLVVGSWLKGSATRSYFKSLDFFFDDLLLAKTSFYSKLLALGFIDDKQYLLPVAFNIPAIVFSRENASLVSGAFTLGLEDIAALGKAYNEKNEGSFVKMGFSPRWDNEFLFQVAVLFGSSFREGAPLAWQSSALEKAIDYVHSWTISANESVIAEDDFRFKYLYDPAAKLASSGRILFAYMTSDEFFTVAADRRSSLDFRWLVRDQNIPVSEAATYLGVCKRGKGGEAADAFIKWFYQEETQRELLENAKHYRTSDTVFGIAGGFSALRTVNEYIYPQFYPGLLGHMPPADYLLPPNILPNDWLTLKQRVVLPYLNDRCAALETTIGLGERIQDWYRDPL